MQTTMERSQGHAIVSFKCRAASTVIDDLYQQGSAKVRIVRTEPHRIFEAVLINTTGGITDGDEFKADITWGQNTRAIVTTQACERYYRSIGKPAKISTQLNVENNACALWLPQEGIMFDGANYQRNTAVELGQNARLLAVESSVFGRLAMGELIKTGSARECWQVRINDRLVFAEALGLEGNISRKLDQPAIAGGAKAVATIVYAGPDNDVFRNEINQIITCNDMQGRATSFDQLTITRLFAPTAQILRDNSVTLLNVLIKKMVPDMGGSNSSLLPRVWSL